LRTPWEAPGDRAVDDTGAGRWHVGCLALPALVVGVAALWGVARTSWTWREHTHLLPTLLLPYGAILLGTALFTAVHAALTTAILRRGRLTRSRTFEVHARCWAVYALMLLLVVLGLRA
jgi:hypothetical protein